MTILSPADEVHIYNVCTALTDAMEVQPSMQWIPMMENRLENCVATGIPHCTNRHFSENTY